MKVLKILGFVLLIYLGFIMINSVIEMLTGFSLKLIIDYASPIVQALFMGFAAGLGFYFAKDFLKK